MNHSAIRLELEASLSRELYDAFDGAIIETILREGKVTQDHDELKSLLEGHSFKITAALAPDLHRICEEVREKLKFTEEVEFFVSNAPTINCFAYPRLEESQSHKVIINSALLERFEDDELRFVIGHEIGHLISKNAQLQKILQFVFPEFERAPIVFQNKIQLWDKLAELTADRYGFIAAPKLNQCINTFIKLSSGLSTSRISFDAMAYLAEMEKVLDYFKSNPYAVASTHPINPVRIKCLQLFSGSELYKSLPEGKEDKKLAEAIQELTRILMVTGSSELDKHRSYFVAAAGIIVAGADKNLNLQEVEQIITVLARFSIFPKEFFDHILARGDVGKIFETSVKAILSENPAERYGMLEYLIGLVLSDNEIIKAEIDMLFDIGEHVFGLSRKELAQIIGSVVQKSFIPRIFKLPEGEESAVSA
ncbi:MAG TPA: M48 family metallopeptidase [bacterium]|nr:M48 family metallopeptidase [bacterium]